jgi:hypothetical protein
MIDTPKAPSKLVGNLSEGKRYEWHERVQFKPRNSFVRVILRDLALGCDRHRRAHHAPHLKFSSSVYDFPCSAPALYVTGCVNALKQRDGKRRE